MARYTGPKCKQCRRFGIKLCQRPPGKCAWERRKSAPGDKSAQDQRRRRVSEYGTQLKEKQKARAIYGILERQFSNYYAEASRGQGVTGDRLMQLLELRLDNVVYRLGFSDSRPQARQVVGHGHVRVNGRAVNIPSYRVKPGDRVSFRDKSKKSGLFNIVNAGMGKHAMVPGWLRVNPDEATGDVMALPSPTEVETIVDTRQIVELYSRR